MITADYPNAVFLTRPLVLTAVLLASAVVMAQESQRLRAPADDGRLLSDEIYRQAEGWRSDSLTAEHPWRRQPKPEPHARIHFGYDSAYEEHLVRGKDRWSSNLHEPMPSTLFRLEFDPQQRVAP